jgi:hypothetical protein
MGREFLCDWLGFGLLKDWLGFGLLKRWGDLWGH